MNWYDYTYAKTWTGLIRNSREFGCCNCGDFCGDSPYTSPGFGTFRHNLVHPQQSAEEKGLQGFLLSIHALPKFYSKGLLNRYTVKSCIGGSNPPLSASSCKFIQHKHLPFVFVQSFTPCSVV